MLEELKLMTSKSRQEVEELAQVLISKNESVLNEIKPGIIEDYNQLKNSI